LKKPEPAELIEIPSGYLTWFFRYAAKRLPSSLVVRRSVARGLVSPFQLSEFQLPSPASLAL